MAKTEAEKDKLAEFLGPVEVRRQALLEIEKLTKLLIKKSMRIAELESENASLRRELPSREDMGR